MRCPRCHETLEAYEPQRRVVAHACPTGEGSFLQQADLQRALPVAAIAALVDAPPMGEGPACPGCAAPMEERAIERHGDRIHLDACTACGGIWFDSGELARAQAPPPAKGGPHMPALGTASHFAGGSVAMAVADPHIWSMLGSFIASLFDG